MLNKILLGFVIFLAIVLALLSVGKYEDYKERQRVEQAEAAALQQAQSEYTEKILLENTKLKTDCAQILAAFSEIPEEDRPVVALPNCGFTIIP